MVSSPERIFTAPEQKLIIVMFINMKSTPDVDWDEVAKQYGYKSGHVARNKFFIARAKCKSITKTNGADGSAEKDGSPATKSVRGAGAGAKRKANNDDAADGKPEGKRGKAAKGKKAAKGMKSDENTDTDDKAKADDSASASENKSIIKQEEFDDSGLYGRDD